ncbi:fimbrial protein [Erwinia sp. BNK-24-b]|uniref:fimbrial protein n=1 Tax=Erwinia TaxID=551 RepID=UPI001FEF76E3|nr:fimbrial protein [Erwinia phyllosphaerae]MBV4367237.1 fimbrial protein [Erwinia phyllosphaerae]
MKTFCLAKKYGFFLVLLSAAAGWSGQVFALSCSLVPGYGVINYTLPLQSGNLTVGPDVSEGTIIYRQYFKPSRAMRIICSSSTVRYQPTISYYYSTTPNSPSTWANGSFAGKVYETGVAGIGIAIYRSNSSSIVPFSSNDWVYDTTKDDAHIWEASTGFDFDIVLIKTGTVTPGTISGSRLPTMKYDFSAQNVSGLNLGSLSFTGALRIVSKTCTTPDVTVPMGKHETQSFTRPGSTSAWVDASIKLTDCPRFYGMLNDGRNTWNSDNGSSGMGAITNNVLTLSLSPNTAIVNSTNGIIGLKTGSDSATGVGIQLAYGSTSDSSPTLVNLNGSKNYTMQNDTLTTQTMPLIARYIQTESTVNAGRADATVTFTISYY